jgi:peptidoglycan/xylan/chitin deacetylase (PgdA/CDA1 family)
MKRAVAAVGYGLGLTQAGSRLGDVWGFRKRSHFFSVARKTEETFMVLIYHRVNDEKCGFQIDKVPPRLFRRQMEYLARHFHVLALEDILGRIRSGEALPKRCVVVTFDDGYEDNYLHAFPILDRLGLPATIFLSTGCINGGPMLWFDRVLDAFNRTSRHTLALAESGTVLSFQTPREKGLAAFDVLALLKSLSGPRRSAAIDDLASKLGVEETPGGTNNMLTWAQVREMAGRGMKFGAHTVTHPILSKISLQEAEWEIAESKRAIESQIGRPVHVFAYPNGKPEDFSPGTMELVKKSGFQAALTTVWGANAYREDSFLLKRITASGQDLASFALTLSHCYLAIETHG